MCWGRSWSCPTPSCKTSGLHCAPGFQDIHCVWLLREATGCSSALTLPAFLPSFQVFLVLSQSLTGHTLSHTQSRKHPKVPPAPRAFSPFPGDEEAKPDPRVCTKRLPWKTHSGINKTTAKQGPKPLLRLPRMRHRELNPAEGGSCCSPSPPLQTLPVLLDPGSRRAQGLH